jgi:hypothetical protein
LLEELVAEIDRFARKEENSADRRSLERWRAHYQERLSALKDRLALLPEASRYAASKDRDLFAGLMNRSRRRLTRMRRRGQITEEVRRRIEYDFDMEEQRVLRLLDRLGHE